jgi:hypothetical protein
MGTTNFNRVDADEVNAALGSTTPAAEAVLALTQNGAQVSMPQILAAAGATQGTAGAITKGTVIVTVTASTQGVKLPTAATGQRVRVMCPGTVGVKVYPNTGDKISTAKDAVTWAVQKGA